MLRFWISVGNLNPSRSNLSLSHSGMPVREPQSSLLAVPLDPVTFLSWSRIREARRKSSAWTLALKAVWRRFVSSMEDRKLSRRFRSDVDFESSPGLFTWALQTCGLLWSTFVRLDKGCDHQR